MGNNRKFIKGETLSDDRFNNKVSFSFANLHKVSYDRKEDNAFLVCFIERLKKLCQLGWSGICTSHRHSFGMEKIPIEKIKADTSDLPKDMNHLLALRATGDNHAFLGYRIGNVFEVVFIESAFGDIYNH